MSRPPLLGQLETAVMEHLWDAHEGDVRSVHAAVGVPRNVTSNTVQSTLDRLYKKGLLRRDKVSHAFVYQPAMTREGFRARVISEVAAVVSGGDAEPMLAAFVDVAETIGDDTLARLEALVAARRRAREDER